MAKDGVLKNGELLSAMSLLRDLTPETELESMQPSSPQMVYTTLATLWMLTLQRLGGGKTLEGTVKQVLSNAREIFPQNKRVEEGTLSLSSAAYSDARKRLNHKTVEHFAKRVCDSLIDSSPPSFEGRRAFIIDGTTITLEPTPELQAAFPPATNQ